MRDDYDKAFSMSNMNCNLVQSLKWSFFGIGVNDVCEKAIIEHLLSCQKCRKSYEEYAKKVGWGKFDVEDVATKYRNKTTALNKPKDSWMVKYQNEEIIRLAASKAIRQIIMSVKNKDFCDFLVKKVCQKLDHLELCYEKEAEVTNENPR